MSDSEDDAKFFSARVDPELEEAAGPWDRGEKKAAIEKMLKRRAYGDAVVETEGVIEKTREQLEGEISAFKRIEREFSNVPSFASVAERIKEERIERTHEVARTNRGRLTNNEERVAERDADPEAASPGFDISPVEAAEQMVGDGKYDDGTVPDAYLAEGPENAAVQNSAEECGMDPSEFFEFLLDHLDDSQLEVSGSFRTRYDKREPNTRGGVATDGGGSP